VKNNIVYLMIAPMLDEHCNETCAGVMLKRKMKPTNNKLSVIMYTIIAVAIFCLYILIRETPIDPLHTVPNDIATRDIAAQLPDVLLTDRIVSTKSAFVIPEYKLIFFTFPKVACSEWKRMFMRMNDVPEWCIVRGINAHDPIVNKIQTLREYPTEIVSAMMTSPSWTKAAFVREPKERVLSAFLDKSVKEPYFAKYCCNKIKNSKMKKKCIAGQKDFKSFLFFVSTYPDECSDVHWEAQVDKIDDKWWPFINFIGYQSDLVNDAERLLKTVVSTRDAQNRNAWDRYGYTGWGASNCGVNRTYGFLEENSSAHKLDTGSRMREWYTAETEELVEQLWAVEWTEKSVHFPTIKLF